MKSAFFCKTCGNANPSQATFCMTCGEPLNVSMASSRSLTGLLVQDQLLKYRYRILTQVGRGGFAAVYKAMDTHLNNRVVAVKEMSQSGLSSKELNEAIEAFNQEAQMLAGLQHPGLPRIYDYFSEGGRWYLVMDFIEGETLEDILLRQRDHRLPLEETLDIGIQICSILDYLHSRQPSIIFRDLKPANIMRVFPNHLYLIDFGIARHFKPGQVKDTMPFGSPGYAAPEQYGKSQTTTRSDIYSLGVLLHELLSGEDPSSTPFILAPLRLYGPGMAELEDLIARMTALKPEQRPDSVMLVQQTLKDISAQSRGKQQSVRSPLSQDGREQPTSYSEGQERSEGYQQQVQEQILSSPENPGRRRLIVGGILAGVTLATGVGGFLAFSSRPRGTLPSTRTTPILHATSVNRADHLLPQGPFAPDVMNGFSAQHTRFNPAEKQLNTTNVAHLQQVWISQELGQNYFSSPVISDTFVYLCTGGYFYALDTATGNIRWKAKTSFDSGYGSAPAVVNGIIYICLQNNRLYALNAKSGATLWTATVNDEIGSSPIVSRGIVYVAGRNVIYAFASTSGRQLWRAYLQSINSDVTVDVDHSLVYVTFAGTGPYAGRVYALDASTGQTRWVSQGLDKGIDSNSSPTVANGMVYIGAGDGGIAAFDAATGRLRWLTDPVRGSTGSSPAVAYGRVYYSYDQVYAFEEKTGQILWVSPKVGAYNSDSPFVANGVVYVGSAGNNCVYALDAATGQILWTSPRTNGQIFTTPVVANGVVYLASQDRDGAMYAFRVPGSN